MCNMQDPSSFDLIIAIHILEHVPDFKKALHNLYLALSDGGSLIIMIPQRFEYKDTFVHPEAKDALSRKSIISIQAI